MRERVPAEVFGKTEEKIDGCFACGYGTILYFEDMAIVRSLQESFPTYKDNFPIWAEQTDAMHQLAHYLYRHRHKSPWYIRIEWLKPDSYRGLMPELISCCGVPVRYFPDKRG